MFYASKLWDYVEEGLLFQNITKSKKHTCWPRSPISSHSIKLCCATFCWFCDAGSQIINIKTQEYTYLIGRLIFNIPPRLCPANYSRLRNTSGSRDVHKASSGYSSESSWKWPRSERKRKRRGKEWKKKKKSSLVHQAQILLQSTLN